MPTANNPPIQAILFDFDGTLMDSLVCFHFLINLLLQEQGAAPISAEQLRPHVDKGSLAVIEWCFGLKPNTAKATTLQQRFFHLWLTHMTEQTHFFPGATDLLNTLNRQQLPWGIVSNRPTRFAEPLIAYHSIYQQAACLIWGDTFAKRKPNATQLHRACTQLQLSTERVLYVGDTENDMIAAHAAGMPFALAEYGYLRSESLGKPLAAEYRIKSPLQLINVLEKNKDD